MERSAWLFCRRLGWILQPEPRTGSEENEVAPWIDLSALPWHLWVPKVMAASYESVHGADVWPSDSDSSSRNQDHSDSWLLGHHLSKSMWHLVPLFSVFTSLLVKPHSFLFPIQSWPFSLLPSSVSCFSSSSFLHQSDWLEESHQLEDNRLFCHRNDT